MKDGYNTPILGAGAGGENKDDRTISVLVLQNPSVSMGIMLGKCWKGRSRPEHRSLEYLPKKMKFRKGSQ